jgi:hypothetical protein
MDAWQVALIASGSALLGTLIAAGFALWGVHIQTNRARELEDIRRKREVREKRINKIEETLNFSATYCLGLLEIHSQYAQEDPNNDYIKNIRDDITAGKRYSYILGIYLAMAGAKSLHDEVFEKLLLEQGQIMTEVRIIDLTDHPKTKPQREEMKIRIEKLQTKASNLFIHIYERLDYLRTQ